MRALEDDLFPSTPGKVKIERAGGAMNRQLHRCFASTSTMFLWALFLAAMTASYLSFQSFVDTSSKYFVASWGGLNWESQIRASAARIRAHASLRESRRQGHYRRRFCSSAHMGFSTAA